jgi:PAS domain S-box-containing protein
MNEVFWTRVGDTRQLMYVSPAFERVWGRSCRDACLDASLWFDAIHPDQRAAVRGAYDALELSGQFDVEYRIVRPDGTIRWVRDRGVPIPDTNRQQRRIAGIAEDITSGKALERQIAELTVHEQRRIGQELHDSLGQQLTGIGLLAKTLERKLEAAGSPAASSATDLEQNVGIAQRQLRRLVKGLMPVEVAAVGLPTALQQLARTTEQLCNVVCTFHCEHRVTVDDDNAATNLYHIAQEAVTNAVRHAGARHIGIRIAEQGNSLLLQIDDDGVGVADSPGHGDGMGLKIMSHRAAVVGAAVEIGARDGGGTRVLCTLPRESSHVAATT